jgi:hypothetical protein
LEQVARRGGDGRRPGQGDIDAILGEAGVDLGRVELRGATFQQRLQRLPGLVSSLADRPALIVGQISDPTQDPGQLRLAAQITDPQLLQLLG